MPDVAPCRTSPPMPLLVHVSRETPDGTPCHTSPPQGVPVQVLTIQVRPYTDDRIVCLAQKFLGKASLLHDLLCAALLYPKYRTMKTTTIWLTAHCLFVVIWVLNTVHEIRTTSSLLNVPLCWAVESSILY